MAIAASNPCPNCHTFPGIPQDRVIRTRLSVGAVFFCENCGKDLTLRLSPLGWRKHVLRYRNPTTEPLMAAEMSSAFSRLHHKQLRVKKLQSEDIEISLGHTPQNQDDLE